MSRGRPAATGRREGSRSRAVEAFPAPRSGQVTQGEPADEAPAGASEVGDSGDPGMPGGEVERGRPRRRARSRRVRRILGGAIVAGAVWWLGWSSPLTQVEHVVVSAPRDVSESAIRFASGISGQDHVLAVDAEQVRSAIMSAIPAVADVRVYRRPPHTIRLDVREREPLAALAAGKGYLVLDAEGVTFDRVSKPGPLPVIESSTQQGRDTARQVLVSLPADLAGMVRRLAARTRDDVTLTLEDSAVVRWGSVDEVDLKSRVLRGLLPVEAARYDVSAPLLPTTSGRLN